MRSYFYHRPRSLEEALRLKAETPDARFIAGGTDVMVQLRHRALRPRALISLRALEELRGIKVGERAQIGALTPIRDVTRHPGLRERYPVLVQGASRLGSPQIRNVATIGGNLCNASPCADTATPLLVLEARLRLRGPRGSREVPLDQFFLGPGQSCLAEDELLVEILLDPPTTGSRSTFQKKGRVRMDLALASLAILLQLEGDTCSRARVAAGSVAPRPLRLREVESHLEGKTLSASVIAAAQEIAMRTISPITDVRSTAEYRRQIVGVYLKRALEVLTGQRSEA
jgi:CO/xanthine dehydrogenase FAD-binding subunit